MNDPMIYARAVHFAATLSVAGVVCFAVLIAQPAFRLRDAAPAAALWRARLAVLAWPSLVLTLLSGIAWLVLAAAAMSGRPLPELFSQDLLWTVLARTEFGNDWLLRAVVLGLLAATLGPLLSPKAKATPALDAAALVLAAALVGSLAWSGHAAGGIGGEAIVHPIADVLHLIAAAAWLGSLVPLALLLAAAQQHAQALAAARTATRRFSMLGVVSVGTLIGTGAVNSWYLVGSVQALIDGVYGRLLLAKLALFVAMVAIAAVNRLSLTPRLLQDANAAALKAALLQLRRNAFAETALGMAIIAIVAVLGTQPPASHAGHHAAYGAIPADAAFVHIHSEQGMADLLIEPGRTGSARVSIQLWDEDLNQLDARAVTLRLAPPGGGGESISRIARLDADGAWQVDPVALSQPGNWTVTIDALLGNNRHLVLDAPIVIEPEP